MKEGNQKATLGRVIANSIVNTTSVDDPVRAYRLANDLYDGGKQFSLKEDDLDYIIKQWQKMQYTPLLKGQVQLILEDLKLSIKHKKEVSD